MIQCFKGRVVQKIDLVISETKNCLSPYLVVRKYIINGPNQDEFVLKRRTEFGFQVFCKHFSWHVIQGNDLSEQF